MVGAVQNEQVLFHPDLIGVQNKDSLCTVGHLAQLVRASHLHCEGQGFESLSAHILPEKLNCNSISHLLYLAYGIEDMR